MLAGNIAGSSCPVAYRAWVQKGKYTPLEAPRTIQYRTKAQQQPETKKGAALVKAIYDYFAADPHGFEACAIELWSMQAKESVNFVATRRSADGGRDAYGWYHLGPDTDIDPLESRLSQQSPCRPLAVNLGGSTNGRSANSSLSTSSAS